MDSAECLSGTQIQSESEPRPSTTEHVPIYIVHSSFSLGEIRRILEELNSGYVGPIRVDRKSDGTETNRTICLLEPTVYETAVEEGYDTRQYGFDFMIRPYVLRDGNFPRTRNETKNLFIPLPSEMDSRNARSQLEAKMQIFIEHGIINKNGFTISIPLKSRGSGDHKGSAFIIFKKIDITTCAIIKLIIHDTWWKIEVEEKNDYKLLHCYWSRSRDNRRKKSRKPQ